jgi:hypothetical protein
MMKMIRNNKGVAPIVAVLAIFAVLVLLYAFLFLPIPAFKAIRYSINYWIILVAFFAIQVGIIYVYYKGISYLTRGFSDIKKNILTYTDKFKKFIHLKFRV